MVSTLNDEISVSDVKLSSVVPATVTEEGKVHELTCMDLAMKLHYIKGLYFFINKNKGGENNDNFSISSDDLTIKDVKKAMFPLLDPYHRVAGRIRRWTENGRPYIKCNDCGVRTVEAQCDRTVEEVLLAMDDDETLYRNFVYSRVIGPDPGFSPLVFMQFTWFKCGGVSLGLSWAHVLGDVFSAVAFINLWGSIMAGNPSPKSLALPEYTPSKSDAKVPQKTPLFFKPIVPNGDNWTIANTTKMVTRSIHLNSKQVSNLKKAVLIPAKISLFETLVAILWKSIANIRKEIEPKCVTICRTSSHRKENEAPSNNQFFSTVEAEFPIGEADVVQLAELVYEKSSNAHEGLIEKSGEIEDLIVYGANLTFVDLTGANIYGIRVKGHKLIYGSYIIDGIGDEGAVLVLPGEENGGVVLKITLPEDQFANLKKVLKTNWDIA